MRRVRRPKKHEALLQRLKGDDGPFDTLAEVLTFAAAYGYANDARESFSETNEAIDWEVFQNLGARSLVAMLAASTTDDIEILGDEHGDERLTIFEEFACGGLTRLSGALPAQGQVNERLVATLLDEEGPAGGEPDVDFDMIADELAG